MGTPTHSLQVNASDWPQVPGTPELLAATAKAHGWDCIAEDSVVNLWVLWDSGLTRETLEPQENTF